jgi:hypothetical protein
MGRRRVDKIEPVSATAPTNPVSICQTNSILTDPDGRWVAARQSAITAGLERRIKRTDDGPRGIPSCFSGENERIGEPLWDENTPVGRRFIYI